MKKKFKKIIILILLIISIFYIIYSNNSNKNGTIKTVTTENKEATVEKRDIIQTLTAPGEVKSGKEEKLTLSTSYYYSTMCAEENEIIRKGSNILKYTNGKYLVAPYDCVITDYYVPKVNTKATSSHYINISSIEDLFMDINISEEEFNKFYSENVENVLKNANIMAGAEIIIQRLKEKFEFIIVTARSDFETDIAIEKLTEIGLDDIPIFNNEEHKIDRLINEKVDYLIDDDNNVCINAANKGICTLYLKNNAQNRINMENIINVNNWGEIYKYLILNNK